MKLQFIFLILVIIFGVNCFQKAENNEVANPGVEIQLTQQSLNHLVKKLIITIEEVLEGLKIPDIQLVKDTIHLNIKNGVLKQFVVDEKETHFIFTPDDNIELSIKLQEIEVDFEYNIKETIFSIGDLGTIELKDLLMDFNLEVLNDNGKIEFRPNKIRFEKGDVEVNLGTSVIKDLASDLLEKGLEDYLESITATVSESVIKALLSLNDIIPQYINIEAVKCILDLSLVEDPFVQQKTLFLKLNGAFYPEDGEPYTLNPQTKFESIPGNISTKIFMHQDVINSLLQNTLTQIEQVGFNFPGGILSTTLFNSMTFVSVMPGLKPYVEYKNWHAVGLDFSELNPYFEVMQEEQKLSLKLDMKMGIFLKSQTNPQEDIIFSEKQEIIEKLNQENKKNKIDQVMETVYVNYKKNQNNKKDDDVIDYVNDIDLGLDLVVNLLQENNDITVQIFRILFDHFQPLQSDVENGKISVEQFQRMGAFMESLVCGTVNGYFLYNHALKLDQILQTDIEQFEISYGDQYITLLVDI